MKSILVLGATGHLGKVLVKLLLDSNYYVVVLVRNSKKLTLTHNNLKIIQGDVTDTHDLSKAVSGVTVVISVLGHGFRTHFPIQKKTMAVLLPLLEKNNIKRFITVTGAGLRVKGDPYSFTAAFSEKLFYLVDPYRMSDAKNQQRLIEKSDLDWTVVRTPVHNNKQSETISSVGFTQAPLWRTLSRVAVSIFILKCIEKNQFIRKAPIIY